MSEPGTAESEAAEAHVYGIAASGWNQHVAAAWLHGSPTVFSAVENLDRHIVKLFLLARVRRLTWDEFQEERKPFQEALETAGAEGNRQLLIPRSAGVAEGSRCCEFSREFRMKVAKAARGQTTSCHYPLASSTFQVRR